MQTKEIHRVIVSVRYGESHRQRLRDIFSPAEVVFVNDHNREHFIEELQQADVAILAGNASPEILKQKCLKWVHCDHAGIDGYAPPELLSRNFIVTTSSGRSGPALAEHVIFFMLALAYEYPRFLRAQRFRVWGLRGQDKLYALNGRNVLVVGAGHTGKEIARVCVALGMQVIGFRRRAQSTPANFFKMFSTEEHHRLVDLVSDVDVVVLATSLNDTSHKIVGREELRAMRRSAYLINIARGSLVDERALIHALRSRWIAGAALDVVEDEPLSINSSLWRCPNLLLTPHTTPRLKDRTGRSLAIIRENVKRFQADEPLLNQLGPSDAYSVPQRSSVL